MFFMEEYEIDERDMFAMIQESVSDDSIKSDLRTQIIDPIFAKLKDKSVVKSYIDAGNSFIEDNAEMLAKEYPTKPVSFPRKYVDNVLGLFGYDVNTFKSISKSIFERVPESPTWAIEQNPTYIISAVILYYADMVMTSEARDLRDSACQQLGLSIYSNRYNLYFKKSYDEGVMAYTYMNLNGSWGIVKSENMVNWIGNTVNTVYACWKTRLSINMTPNILAKFLNGVRNAFNQNMKQLSIVYHANLTEGNSVGKDIDDTTEYVTTNNFTKTRDNILRLIKNGDKLYDTKSNLYTGIAKLKNIKLDTLFKFAQEIDHKDIAKIIDGIFYVFIVKEGNTMADINSTKYMSRITNLPTAVDRAVTGKPIILPLSKKYSIKASVVIAYICLIATYIMQRINDLD